MRELENIAFMTQDDPPVPVTLPSGFEVDGRPKDPRPATTAVLLRVALEQTNYQGMKPEHQFRAFGINQRLGPHLKTTNGPIVLDEDEYCTVKEVVDAFPGFKSTLLFVPLLIQIRDAVRQEPVAAKT